MIAGIFAVLIFLLWGTACAMFDVAEGNRWVTEGVPTRGASVAAFVGNAIEYIPKLPQVVSYIFTERLWYVFVVIGVLGAATLFAILAKRVQRQLEEPSKKRIRSVTRK
jgi:cytosine/uracil/thiamine/allantoin permease